MKECLHNLVVPLLLVEPALSPNTDTSSTTSAYSPRSPTQLGSASSTIC
jgi:hypothetical protein